MTIGQLLDYLDGRGIVFEDDDLVAEALQDYGLALNDTITVTSPSGTLLLRKEE